MAKSKLSSIIEGWKNDNLNKKGKLPRPLKELFDNRLQICKSNECEKLLLGICTACGCPVKKKTKSLQEECPENMWSPVVYTFEDETFIISSDIPSNELRELLDVFVAGVYLEISGVVGAVAYSKWQEFIAELDFDEEKRAGE